MSVANLLINSTDNLLINSSNIALISSDVAEILFGTVLTERLYKSSIYTARLFNSTIEVSNQ